MKRSATVIIVLLTTTVILTGCATAAAHPPLTLSAIPAPPPSIGPQVSGAEVETQIDTSPVVAQAESGLVAIATAHLKRASELAANGGDPVGKACHDSSLNLVLLLSIGVGHEDGFAPKLEKARLLAKTLKGPAVEQWEVTCSPVAFEAKMDLLALAKAIFGDAIAAKVGLPIVGAVKGMLP